MLLFVSQLVFAAVSLALLAALVYAIALRTARMSPQRTGWANVVLLMTLVYPWSLAVGDAANRVLRAWQRAPRPHAGITLGAAVAAWARLVWAVELLPLLWAMVLALRLLREQHPQSGD